MNTHLKYYKFEIFGAVQGVGFRPFIYTLAIKHNILGEVYNDSEGVKIIAVADDDSIRNFEFDIINSLPPLARIDKIQKTQIQYDKEFSKFSIITSQNTTAFSPILPDFAICDDCINEFNDPLNHRFKYPFINCTNCGPRFSIIKSLPYDRANTTMDKFKMCDDCLMEYENPLDRRYHAQPISCKNCGPKIFLKDRLGEILCTNDDAIKKCIDFIKEGKILAIKGLGGFHLVCDSRNEASIKNLRERKNRPNKPFAIMAKDVDMINKFAYISEEEKDVLISHIKPIVILKSKNNGYLAPNLAPNLNKIGVFLPNTGLHLRIFDYIDFPIIATSANITGEPIISDDKIFKISNCFDYALDNDREIYNSSDDSIIQIIDKSECYLRTSRGLNPRIFISDLKFKGTYLALGAEMKNQFLIYHNSLIIISPYIGDMKNIATLDRFYKLLNFFIDTYNLKFDCVITDKHPNFYPEVVKKLNVSKTFKVQHHYAHLLSVLFDNDLLNCDNKFLGFAFDGTGYGDDGTIWGGEVIEFDKFFYKRKLSIDEFALIGGESAIKNIYKIAISMLIKYDLMDFAKEYLKEFDELEIRNLGKIYKNSIKTSSIGRMIDGFGAIILRKKSVSFDGEIGLILESFYDESIDEAYRFEIIDNKINFCDALKSALVDDKVVACSKFLNAIADLIIEISKMSDLDIVLSGGVFQNSTILKRVIKGLQINNKRYFINHKIPTNDSGICVGQMVSFLYSKDCDEKR